MHTLFSNVDYCRQRILRILLSQHTCSLSDSIHELCSPHLAASLSARCSEALLGHGKRPELSSCEGEDPRLRCSGCWSPSGPHNREHRVDCARENPSGQVASIHLDLRSV